MNRSSTDFESVASTNSAIGAFEYLLFSKALFLKIFYSNVTNNEYLSTRLNFFNLIRKVIDLNREGIISIYYEKFIKFFKNKKSNGFLYFIAFIESIFFPLPTDPFFIPYILSQKKFYKLVLITTTFSVAGGIVTYVLGNFFTKKFQVFYLLNHPKLFLLLTVLVKNLRKLDT